MDYISDTILSTIVTAIVAPAVLLLIQNFVQRRKNKLDYGDDLLETMNKTAASLREARTELQSMEQEIKSIEKEHEQELEDMKNQHNARIDRLKSRITELEKFIVKYDISFSLTTHPNVQITDLKVVGKEDVLASQKMKAIREAAEKK